VAKLANLEADQRRSRSMHCQAHLQFTAIHC